MNWISVHSTTVESSAYNLDTSELYVKFLSGRTYIYFGVPENVYNDFLLSGSKGRFVHNVLRHYRYEIKS